MTEDLRLLDRAMEMTFTSDVETAERLRRLVTTLDLPYDNIAARWAVSRSLADGPLQEVGSEDQSHGKELRGRTLFGAVETAALLVAGLVVVEGPERANEGLRELVLGHWKRGQILLDEELRSALDDPDVLVRQSVERILGAQIHDVDLSAEIIGQDQLVQMCRGLLDEARSEDGLGGHIALGMAAIVVGPVGSGRTHVALAIARSLGGDCVMLNARHVRTMAVLRTELHDQIPGASSGVAVLEDLDHASPALVRALAKVARDGRIKPSKGQEIAPFSVVGVSRDDISAAGWKRLELEPYDRDAVAQIIRNYYGWHLEVRRLVALAGRLRPALALRRAEELEKLSGTPRVTDRHAALAMENWGLDRLGLDQDDREVMASLASGEPASLSHLSDMVRVGPARLADLVLPYLAELGLIEELGSGQWRASRAGLDVYGGAQ